MPITTYRASHQGAPPTKENVVLECREGHPLTGEEPKDVTGTLKCQECKALRKKNWKMEGVGISGVRYRRAMREVSPSDEQDLFGGR